ncbi:hypothetical protein DL98DRAFT_565840 [Cadophora sp. DSE1049]|nr:hypothetical protein DL98DRAFT_565840 [Cadophora sp. DSE1049]
MAGERRSPRNVFPRIKLRIKYTPRAEEVEEGSDDDDGDVVGDDPSMSLGGKTIFKPGARGGRSFEGSNRQPPRISDEPIPFKAPKGGDGFLAGLLPYLALGFTPQFTPANLQNDPYKCGINALATSLAAVRNLIAEDSVAEGGHLSAEDIQAMLEAPEFAVEAREFLIGLGLVDKATGEPLKEQLEVYLLPNIVELQQLIILMRLINARLDSHFNIGFITDGYRGRYETKAARKRRVEQEPSAAPDPDAAASSSDERIWDPDFVEPHGIYFQQQYKYDPTVWLRNDNAGTISENQDLNPYFAEEVNHWEALTPDPNIRARRAVDRWNLEGQTRALVGQGLAMVRRTVDVDHEGEIQKIYAGHFVTIVPKPPDTPTSGTAVVDIGDQYGEMAVSNLKIVSYTHNTGLPTEPPRFKPGVRNFRILMVNKPPPRGSQGKYPVINNFKISQGELFHALPGTTELRPKVRRLEGGETGEIDNAGGFMGVFFTPWGLEGTQRLVSYPDGMVLPLASLARGIPGTEFEAGDVVLVMGRVEGAGADEDGMYCVRDVDGDVEWASEGQMERMVREPFGLRFGGELEGKLKMLTAKAGGRKGEKGKKKEKGGKRGKRNVDETVPVEQANEKKTKASGKKGGKSKADAEEKEKAKGKTSEKRKADEDVSQPEASKKKTKVTGQKTDNRKADEDLPSPKASTRKKK